MLSFPLNSGRCFGTENTVVRVTANPEFVVLHASGKRDTPDLSRRVFYSTRAGTSQVSEKEDLR
jgi:hypothetical protein